MPKSPVERLCGMIGLCKRAGKLAPGSALTCDAIASGAPLALFASDASENTRKRITDRCAFYHTACNQLPIPSGELGHAIGSRSNVAAVGILDPEFARAIRGLLEESAREPSATDD